MAGWGWGPRACSTLPTLGCVSRVEIEAQNNQLVCIALLFSTNLLIHWAQPPPLTKPRTNLDVYLLTVTLSSSLILF